MRADARVIDPEIHRGRLDDFSQLAGGAVPGLQRRVRDVELVEIGFEFVNEINGHHLYKKRK